MNKYQLTILCSYILVMGAEFWLKILNIGHMKKHGLAIPRGFEGYIDQSVLRKAHQYTVETSTFSLIESIFESVLIVMFIFGGLLNLYDAWLASLRLSFISKGLIFFLLLGYASTFLSIPFSLYGTFRIENKFGFNVMTPKLWIADFAKSELLSTILMGLAVLGGLSLIERSPKYWWLFVWGFFFIFSLFVMYISPYVIEPLFNKFSPLDGEGLEDKIRSMLERTGIRVSRVFRMDASRRSRHTNAYFTGIGSVKRIVLYDTLLEKMDQDEVLAIIAHEAGHWKKKHVLKMIILFEALSFAGAYVAFRVLGTNLLSDIFNMQNPTLFSKVVILGFIISIISFPFTPLLTYFSRRHEKEADGFAVELTSKPESLATSLIKLSKDNLSNLHPHPLYAMIYYSHPPVVERVRRIMESDRKRG